MTTDNHQDQNRIDRLEAAFIDLAEARSRQEETQRQQAETQRRQEETQRRQEETQRQQLAAIQRHDMLLEMAQAIQRDHEQTLQMVTSNQERFEAAQERHEAAQERYEAAQERHEAALERHEETMRILASNQERHEETLQMLTANQERLEAAQERHEATQNQIVWLVETVSTMLNRVIDTQQEHSLALRGLLENRVDTP